MSVVNCRVKYIRPKYKNLKEWTEDPNNVYIGRAGIVFIDGKRFPTKASLFANPFKVRKIDSRGKIVDQYKQHITKRIDNETWLKVELLKLKGKNLGCWCKPEKCHGDVLLNLIEHYSK